MKLSPPSDIGSYRISWLIQFLLPLDLVDPVFTKLCNHLLIDTGNDTRLVKSVDQSGDIYVFVESVNRAQIMFPILLIC